MGDEEKPKADERWLWMLDRIETSFLVKREKIEKCYNDDNSKRQIMDFLDRDDSRHIIFYDNGADIVATIRPPVGFKKKSLFFAKMEESMVDKSGGKLGDNLFVGEFAPAPMEQLSTVAQEIYFPLLTNPKNQEGWPEVVTREVTENLYKFLQNVTVTVGHTKGQTILPLPPTEATSLNAARDKERVHLLESAVVTWTRQIKNVLKTDPEEDLKAGLNPGPEVELDFWQDKARNLNSLHKQLCGEKIRKVVKVLEVTKSTYFPSFNRLCQEVAQARVEANSNIIHLKPLKDLLTSLASDDFPDLMGLFKPVMHTILLIWKSSKYYNTPARLVVLMREICNDLITQACKFVNGESLFELEPQEAVDNLKLSLKVCVTFKSTYFDYKARAGTECPSNPWRFQNSALFSRLDSFLERCHDVLDLTQTILQFSKLEKIEIGGTKGKILTTSVRQIFEDFQRAVSVIQTAPYEIVNVEAKEFDDDFYLFRCQINELERRLGSVITQAFDDCTTIYGCFKLLDSFEGLLEREIIQTDLERKNVDLLNSYNHDLKQVQELFMSGKDDPLINDNMPPKAGAVNWCRGLVERVEDPMNRLKGMGKAILETEEGKEVIRMYSAITTSLQEFEQAKVEEWAREIENTSQEKLKQALLSRDESTEFLHVNFDPALVCLLREVKYFLLLSIDVPESAMTIYTKAETFRQQTGNLELIVNIYNRILATLIDVERPLVQNKLDNIDKVLQKGLKHLNWKSHSIPEFIQQTMSIVKDTNSVLLTIKNNVIGIQKILRAWAEHPMMDRKTVKTYTPDEFQQLQQTLIGTRYNEIEQGTDQIHDLLQNSNKVLKVSKNASAWKAYTDYVNNLVVEGLVLVITNSQRYFKKQVDPAFMLQNDVNPLLEVKLKLSVPDICFAPDMGLSSQGAIVANGIRDMSTRWIQDFLNVATLMRRLDTGDGDYLHDMQEDIEIKSLYSEINRLVEENEEQCLQFRNTYTVYAYLWQTDLQESFAEFLANPQDFGAKEPSLDEFEKQIAKYRALEDEINQLPMSKQIGWLKIDSKPIRTALQQWVGKWTLIFKEYLLNKVISTMDELTDFMVKANINLDKEVEPEGTDTLLEVMGSIRDIRVRGDATDEMFDPLRATVVLLKRYEVNVKDEVLKQLDEAPMNWSNTKKKTFQTKERLSTLQSDEAEKLKKNVQRFDERVSEFRAHFNKTMPFEWSEDVDAAYDIIDKAHHAPLEQSPAGSVISMQQEAARLNELQELFELNVTEYKEIKHCRGELTNLKMLWDMISLVTNTFREWKRTLWTSIDVDVLTDETKNLIKEVKMLPKLVKSWSGYEGLEAAVKNMSTTLPLIGELRHPSMRDRHWKQLMRYTGVSFVMDEKFSFSDLLALQLHQYVDQVAEIVDRAQKELIIEKSLKKIEDTWVSLNLEFVPFEEGDTLTMQTPEAVIEALEDNVMQLQNMQASKYVAGNAQFLEEVTKWQRKLGAVESVVNQWLEVQKKWTNLQSIFVGSADIRIQLPEDSKRFDQVDGDWKDLMKEASFVPNVVEACNQEGRLERIERMLELLEKCEKALADYLETKRVAFPRFYFVAPADLLDILSKGSNPQLVMRHLPKCFDNVHHLEFEKDSEGVPTKTAVGMYSSEGEYVSFDKPRLCEGAVEFWLKELVDSMRNALRAQLNDSLTCYEEKPRAEWLYDWPAQVVVVVTRIVYTEEVNLTFEQLEDGNETVFKDYNRKQFEQLTQLTELVLRDLTSNDRKKIITLITSEVHARDVVTKLINEKVENNQCFQWMSQLRYGVDEKTRDCKINICDYECLYGYEYIGNCGCLVITPLTDRCYITLTQASRLMMGGAPAGPAGTGKTETTKDLGRALGVMVYVFNCSDQMDYKTMGQIYKGLAQAGAWGCFDEFNRIPIEVLSVCSTQFKCVLDAIRSKKQRFVFEEEEITMEWRPLCMAFITMNPGYAGRTELPENLKALFRPVAMIVPDMDMITEIMLMSEGFADGRVLARKFMILYRLCEDLLSKQDHYDWKLRAIKTTLNVAGGMRREDPQLSEDKVLLRALRDFNIGKLVADDVGIFMGLLNDLFPKTLELVVRKRDAKFEESIKEGAKQLLLQPEDTFVLKISQLRELLVVRWSVFVLGPAGASKTEAIKVLAKAQNLFGEKTTVHSLNPKAVTRNELYGYIHPATREWRDGLISQIFRDLANTHNVPHEWIVLDGDIDAEWIESMNTVMDDNKMLTLASNERIPLTAPMRLLFEVGDLRNASPATVSRGGVIFINETDVGWNPFVQSWIENRSVEGERSQLTSLFSNYVAKSLEHIRKNFKFIVPIMDINMVKTLCFILEGLLERAETELGHSASVDVKLLESLFVIAAIWGFGAALLADKQTDNRVTFDRWWRDEWKAVRFPDSGLIFDYYLDAANNKIVHWSELVTNFVYTPDVPFGNLYVPTMDTTRLTYFLDILSANRHPVMFVGTGGTGKTCIMKEKLRNLDAESMAFLVINLNCFTDSLSLQTTMEQVIEKKTGRVFGPMGNKRLIYFIDDFNMPFVDKYGTQSPIALLRQQMDYSSWYDRAKLTLKEIHNVQYLSCMNPTAGSFTVDPRLQRHYATFAVQTPLPESLALIYGSILGSHLKTFESAVSKYTENITKATIELHKQVSEYFLPTAIKFHYQFNLRDLSNIFQGLLLSQPDHYTVGIQIMRLWAHECERVFGDRMVGEADSSRFAEMVLEVAKKNFDVSAESIVERPLIFTTFTTQTADDSRPYMPVADMVKLGKVLDERLAEYNSTYAVMDLVLFDQAMEHICRLTRIVEQPRGNALAVGVGGSGKQSLSRLAGFICGYETFQITVTQSYGLADFRNDLLSLYQKAGKGNGYLFVLTDGQLVDERFLVYLNDLLASGDIPDLFAKEDRDDMIGSVRSEVKQNGIVDTNENCWDFFIEKVRSLLHVVLCFSPVGEKFRVRARQFPALINCTVIDWFQPWPEEALMKVANRFLSTISNIEDEHRVQVEQHMSFLHTSVSEASMQYMERERRYNYTTPKSYLELIDLYKSLLDKKREEIKAMKVRLESGLEKLKSTSAQVADLQANLKEEQVVVEQKKAATEALLVQVGQETAVAEEQKAGASVEEEKCSVIQNEVSAFAAECQADLAAAEPLLAEAELALAGIQKKDLAELKALANPVNEIVMVFAALMTLTAPGGKIPKDLSWNAGKKMMANVDRLIADLSAFDRDNIPENSCATVEKLYMSNPNFNRDYINTKSGAASGLCSWIVNMCKYFRIFQSVAPKRAKLQEANDKLSAANHKLKQVREKVAELEARLRTLTEQFEQAMEEKNEAIATAEKTQQRADLATRLVNGLADEKVRWAMQMEQFGVQERALVGDVLVAAGFVSYIGAFSSKFRHDLVTNKWIPDILERKIPSTEGIMPLAVLTNEAEIAGWINCGLPSDVISVQNGAIINSSKRWPLLIDPQLQGVTYLINKESKANLHLVQQTQHRYLDVIEQAISNGEPVILENLGESIDAVLEPLIGRTTIRRSTGQVIKMGDKEVDYDPAFRLYLQTRLSNPHYKPEIAAQTTLINFMVTAEGLEDQLLAIVVDKERPDLEEQRQELLTQQNQFKITLKELEDNLLFRLANAPEDVLSDIELIENLEFTKKTAKEIEEKVKEAKVTEININQAREGYRPVSVRGALLYFLIDSLWILDHMYQYSMQNFVIILKQGMDLAEAAETLDGRVASIIESSCFTVFRYISQGLFERHKLIFSTQLTMRILARRGELEDELFEFLIRSPRALGHENPLAEWLPDTVWASVQALREIEAFDNLPSDMESSAKRFREWIELERPEEVPLPGDWKKLPEFQKLLVIRCLRPDRMTEAMSTFVQKTLGKKYVTSAAFDLETAYKDSLPETSLFFVLSPGVDPVKDVEILGHKLGFTFENSKFTIVSLGQGQEPVAQKALEGAHKHGGWVFLQNIHLTPGWTQGFLQKRLDKISEGAHDDFRLFLSADPSPSIPVSILQASIKLTNEPPEGLQANLIRAWSCFADDMFENSSKQSEFRIIVFALSFFHAVVIERKKFGAQGWNRAYPFNQGDLINSAMVCFNYLEQNPKIPWDDLRYIFGEIMYGGHITDDWDRRLCAAYLAATVREELVEGMELFPGFHTPPVSNCAGMAQYCEDAIPTESPIAFGLHPNAEINFCLEQAENLFRNILELQPRSSAGGGGVSLQDKAKLVLDDIVEKIPEAFNMIEILEKISADERGPYTNVFLQEIDRMNLLLDVMRRSLYDLDLGLKGELTISQAMEDLMRCLSDDLLPEVWEKKAYPSLRPLASWLTNLFQRAKQLQDWTTDLALPKVTWLSGLFNPQSFLTAVMQTTARRSDWPLDKTVIQTDVTKKFLEDIAAPSRDGAFIHGMVLEGARWDEKAGAGNLEESRPKELFGPMPVVLIKAVTVDKSDLRDSYACPVYKTQKRGPTYVFTAGLRTKFPASKWVLGGVALLMDVGL